MSAVIVVSAVLVVSAVIVAGAVIVAVAVILGNAGVVAKAGLVLVALVFVAIVPADPPAFLVLSAHQRLAFLVGALRV